MKQTAALRLIQLHNNTHGTRFVCALLCLQYTHMILSYNYYCTVSCLANIDFEMDPNHTDFTWQH